MVGAISALSEDTIIYSGYGGVIVKPSVLNLGKNFLHIHGGYLPDYKGSTTNYYSFLEVNKCGASAIFLEPEIDCGPVLKRKWFKAPDNLEDLDYFYDSALRADVLLDVIKEYNTTGEWNFELKDNKGGETFYIIHPFLKHVSLCKK